MTAELEAAGKSLFVNEVPEMWRSQSRAGAGAEVCPVMELRLGCCSDTQIIKNLFYIFQFFFFYATIIIEYDKN